MTWTFATPEPSQIIRTKVSFYYHYGIFINENEVIQFGLPDDPGRPANEIKVVSTDIYTFLCGGEIEVAVFDRDEKQRLRTPDEIIKTAYSRLGESGYDLLHNNCEHFVHSCVFGESNSIYMNSIREKIRQKLKKKDS